MIIFIPSNPLISAQLVAMLNGLVLWVYRIKNFGKRFLYLGLHRIIFGI